MRDTVMMSVTKVVDDSTGIWAGDLTEISIHCYDLECFLKAHGEKGAEAIKKELDHLKKKTDEYLDKVTLTKEEYAKKYYGSVDNLIKTDNEKGD